MAALHMEQWVRHSIAILLHEVTSPCPRPDPRAPGTTSWGPFIRPPFPPLPPLRLESLQARLAEANIAIGRLDGSIETLPNPDHFVMMYVRKEAVLSSQIEGTRSSLQDLLAAEAQVMGLETPKDVEEVVNYVAALNLGPRAARRASRIGSAHPRDPPAAPAGSTRRHPRTRRALRRTQNWIGPMGASMSDASFVPPPPQEVPAALGSLETFLHTDDGLPLLVKVGLSFTRSSRQSTRSSTATVAWVGS